MTTRILIIGALCSAIIPTAAQAAQTLAGYQATVTAQQPSSYFTFDNGSFTSVAGSSVTLSPNPAAVSGQFTYDVFGNAYDCIFFTLQGDIAYDPNESSDHLVSGGGTATTNSTNTGSISCLFRTVDPGPPSGSTTSPGAKYVFSAGGGADTTNANGLFLYFENPNSTDTNRGALTLGFGDSLTTILAATNVVPDTWYYFALVYNEAPTNAAGQPNTNKATWYLGRAAGGSALASGQTTNLTMAVAGDATDFYIGSHTNDKSSLNKPGDGRVDEFAFWHRMLSPAEVAAQFANVPNTALPPVSAYQTVISNEGPTHYFQLAGNSADSINPGAFLATNSTQTTLWTNAATAALGYSCGYCPDYFLDPLGAAYFSFATDAIYTNANQVNGGGTANGSLGSGKGSISGMFHGLPCTNYYTGQKFIFSAGGSTTTSNALSLILEAPPTNANPWSLKYRFGDSSGVLISNVLPVWYYFAVTYDETITNHQAHWWAGVPGGVLQSNFFSATNGSLAGAGSAFYIGNDVTDATAFRYQNSSHTGNGQISQVAVWNRVLATNEVAAQFNALSVQAAPPSLSIQLAGSNVILSWPSSTDPSYALQATSTLASTNWSSGGASTVVETNFVVTNAVGAGPRFYRLAK